jgi:DNA-binding NtrC family response regulator
MKKTEILIIGRNEEILQTVIRLINNNPEWNGTGVSRDEEAIEAFHRQRFDIVMLTNGIDEEEEKKLRAIFTYQDKDIIIIQHYGGGSGLLTSEILGALATRGPSYTIKDDIFKK